MASRSARLASTSVIGRSVRLHFGLFCSQNDPVVTSVCHVHSLRLPARVGHHYWDTHTHESGSISSGWPPKLPASRIAEFFGTLAKCERFFVLVRATPIETSRSENFSAQQAGGFAVPDPNSFGGGRWAMQPRSCGGEHL